MSSVIHCGKYDVHVGPDMFRELEKFLARRQVFGNVVLLVDRNTRQHALPLIRERVPSLQDAPFIDVEAGERSKSIDTCTHIWNRLTEIRADRQSLLLNLGGGMICDVGGFAASVFLRGIDFIHVPTTLLSMVDSSVGGKTGINFGGFKNQIGTFTRPAAVFISPAWLRTLPDRELHSGFAEMLKHALISSREKWDALSQTSALKDMDWIPAIQDSVLMKNRIVHADFRDRHVRRTLNFGHTVGHALESYSLLHDADPLRHGEAVALGMICELYLSWKLCGLPEEILTELAAVIRRLVPAPVAPVDPEAILGIMKSDKKNAGDRIRPVLLQDIGRPVINHPVPGELVLEALGFMTRIAGEAALNS
jgi:3-dehydroquinate synthase